MDKIAAALSVLTNRVTEFAEEIRTYESDTFSAEGSELTREEAVLCAIGIIASDLSHSREHLDGIRITDALENLREEMKD